MDFIKMILTSLKFHSYVIKEKKLWNVCVLYKRARVKTMAREELRKTNDN